MYNIHVNAITKDIVSISSTLREEIPGCKVSRQSGYSRLASSIGEIRVADAGTDR